MSMLLLVLAAAITAGASSMPDTSKMNAQMIDIEDCRADVWGCIGNTLFEQSTRVPMIVRIPGNPANGQRCDESSSWSISCRRSGRLESGTAETVVDSHTF